MYGYNSEVLVIGDYYYFIIILGSQVNYVVSYPDPYSHSCGWITSPLRGKDSGDVIHPQLWSGCETMNDVPQKLARWFVIVGYILRLRP